jgi:pimeloyl-ACP methyl ester carboxylesterase
MRKIFLACLCVSSVGFAQMMACSSSSSSGSSPSGDGGGNDGAVVITNACTDTDDSIYADPGTLPALDASSHGDIVKCAKDADISMASIASQLQAAGSMSRAPTSGAHVYRILYRTERGDTANSPGTSSALVYLPDTPRASQLPVIVASHGSRGQAGLCAPSKDDPAAQDVEDDFIAQVLPIVGAGYAVIAPDLAGYANYGASGNPPSAYADAEDVGKSTLDGARALRKFIPNQFNEKTALVGHSQGGGTALGALAMAQSYAPEINIAGTAVYAPLWFSQAAWGAILQVAASYPIATDPTPTAVSVWYHYTHGELLDGPGHGLDPFKPSAQATIKQFVDGTCWGGPYPQLESLGTLATDIFDPAFTNSVAAAAALGAACSSTDAVCQKWVARYAADRPHLTGNAATSPLLVLYGGEDTTISNGLARCVFDRLTTDNANYKVCFEPTADHGGIVRVRADYVNDWLANLTLGAAAPTACPEDQSNLVDDAGAPIKCQTPPPNN